MDQIISKIKSLKQIEPNKEWALLTKTRIFEDTMVQSGFAMENFGKRRILSAILDLLEMSYPKKLAYVFAAFLFIIVGMFGFAQYTLPGDPLFPVKKIAEQSQAALSGASGTQSGIENLKKRTQDLETIVNKQKGSNIVSAKQEIKDAARGLSDAIQKEGAQVKEIALEIKNNQVLLSFFEDYDLKQESLALYKAIDEQMISDLEKSTLTESQLLTLSEARALFEKEMYFQALEKLLLVGE